MICFFANENWPCWMHGNGNSVTHVWDIIFPFALSLKLFLYLLLTAASFWFRGLLWRCLSMVVAHCGKGDGLLQRGIVICPLRLSCMFNLLFYSAMIWKELSVISVRCIIFKYTLYIIVVSLCELPARTIILLPYLALSPYRLFSNPNLHHGNYVIIACLFIPTHSAYISFNAIAFFAWTPPPAATSGTTAELWLSTDRSSGFKTAAVLPWLLAKRRPKGQPSVGTVLFPRSVPSVNKQVSYPHSFTVSFIHSITHRALGRTL